MYYSIRIAILFFVLSSATEINAQYGLDLRYSSNNYKNLHGHGQADGVSLFSSNFEIGVDYWLRLGGYRIEFFPQVFFGLDSETTTENGFESQHRFNELGLHLNTHFYIFNFKEDCDCPTFSKQGNFFTKGFFLNAVTGLSGQKQKVSFIADNTDFTRNYWRLQFGGGLGLDIGVSDLITLTPYFNYVFSIANALGASDLPQENTSELIDGAAYATSLQFGVRVGFRPDYKPYRAKQFY